MSERLAEGVGDVLGMLRGERFAPATVREQASALAVLWRDLSRIFFAEALPEVSVEVCTLPPRLASRWDGAEVVSVAAHVARVWPWAVARLLHEAVRAEVARRHGVECEAAYRGHGPRFCDEANRVGALLGVGRVVVRGAPGEITPAEWPMSKPSEDDVRRFTSGAPLPLERHELELLRARVADLEASAARAQELGRRVESLEAERGALTETVVTVCKLIAKVGADTERARVALGTSSGGKAATLREVARVASDVRAALEGLELPAEARAVFAVKNARRR